MKINKKTTTKKSEPVHYTNGPVGSVRIAYKESVVPTVIISDVAARKMRVYMEEMSDEIGWLGSTKREGNNITITDVMLFRQEVHGTTTEITPEGLEEFAMELLQQPDGTDIWNSLKMWGHSHVHMNVSPSGQDDLQMEDFEKIGHDYFVRLIANKKGEIGVDVYEYAKGLEFHNVKWIIEEKEAGELFDLKLKMLELEQQMEELLVKEFLQEEQEVEVIRTAIQSEIKEKVTKLNYRKPHVFHNFVNQSAWWGKDAIGFDETPLQIALPDMEFESVVDYEEFAFAEVDLFKSSNDIYSHVPERELIEYAKYCFTKKELLVELTYTDLFNSISEKDLELIWGIVKESQKVMHDPFYNQ